MSSRKLIDWQYDKARVLLPDLPAQLGQGHTSSHQFATA